MPPSDERPTRPSLLLYFDASVRYGPDHATPTSAAVGFLVEDGSETVIEESIRVDAFVSSSQLEYRALVEAVRAVEAYPTTVASLHVHGDADAVIRAVDPQHPTTPDDRLARHRVAAVRECVADIPLVTYRAVGRDENERAHDLARAGHSR
ncbi:hypothetical protein [Haloarcula marina]|uniref:hypothetical protein n=1 Tax=Haloarcula marina TaxID=2961574 RepID=UPI0020B7D0FF|nr:hypothetical protein [Halomicroarcula marina]